MTRTINFRKDENFYVFEEDGTENKLKIDISKKKLNGLDLYRAFFAEYNIEDKFELIDNTTEEDKKDDYMCKGLYEKMQELFRNIEDALKTELTNDLGDN